MTDIKSWLAEHGFERFTNIFLKNEIDLEALRELTDKHLKELGLPLGPRVKMLKAIQQLALDVPEHGIAEASSHGEAERRQLTVMFVDMVGSTRLSGELDPEDMRQVLLDYQNAVAEAVSRFNGHIARYFGDGVLCYFGWPRAHENAAEQSVRAGLAVTQAVASMQFTTTDAIAARVGIATGLVVVGDIIGEGAAEEEPVVGETPNLAARLQGLARPGEVVLSQTTRRLVDGIFTVSALDSAELKGFTNDVNAFRVTGERSLKVHFEASASDHVSELVGREHELAMIEERWQRVLAGEGQAVLLTGEAGIGKSRIVQAINETLRCEEHYHIRHRCTPLHTDSPLFPSTQHLLHAARFLPEDSNDARLDKLEAVLLDKQCAPVMAELLGLDGSSRYGETGLSSEQLRYQVLHAFSDEVVALAKQRPVVIIMEDAHWIDATSLELLRLVMDKTLRERCLVLIPARPEMDPAFSNHPALTRITLNRLSAQQTREIIHAIAGGKSLPQALVEDIVAKTDGIPLFVEEVTKSVLESDHVNETDDAFEFTVPIGSLAIPATLQDSLMARLDRQQSARELAQMAACIGREFDMELLRAISALEVPALQNSLDQLCEAEVVARRGIEPDMSYRFRHALLRDAAYQSLLKSKRRLIHKRIVEFLGARPSTAPEIVAQHAQQAGLQEKAVDCLRTAASRAIKQSAYAETVALTAKALTWLQALPESDSKLVAETRLQIMQAWALIPYAGYSAARTTNAFSRAVELGRKAEDTSRLVFALSGQAIVMMTRGDHAHLVSIADELQRISDEEDSDFIRFYGVMARGYEMMLRGNIEKGRLHIRAAQALHVDEHERRGLHAGYPLWDGLSWWAGMGAWLAGDNAAADALGESIEKALSHEDLALSPFTRCWVPVFHTLLALANQDLDLGLRLAQYTLKLANEHKIPSYVPWCKYVIALHTMAHGEIEAALEEFAAADVLAAELEFGWAQPTFRIEFAKLLLTRGRIEEARQFCREAAEVIARTRESWWQPELLRTEGDLYLAENKTDEAEAAYLNAVDVARGQGARSWQLRAEASLARLREQQ